MLSRKPQLAPLGSAARTTVPRRAFAVASAPLRASVTSAFAVQRTHIASRAPAGTSAARALKGKNTARATAGSSTAGPRFTVIHVLMLASRKSGIPLLEPRRRSPQAEWAELQGLARWRWARGRRWLVQTTCTTGYSPARPASPYDTGHGDFEHEGSTPGQFSQATCPLRSASRNPPAADDLRSGSPGTWLRTCCDADRKRWDQS